MIREPGQWGEVAWGMYVMDRQDVAWRVQRRYFDGQEFDAYDLISRDGRALTVHPDPSAAVTVLVPTTPEVIATFQQVFGDVDGRGVRVVDDLPPPTGRTQKQTDARILRYVTHLQVMHGDHAETVGAVVHNRTIDWHHNHLMQHARPEQGWIAHVHASWKA